MAHPSSLSAQDKQKNIHEELLWDNRIDASGIAVEVHGTTVRLTGTVPTYADRRHAENDIRFTPGITAIDNRLTVDHPGYIGTPSDQDIEDAIHSLFTLNTAIHTSEISLRVEGGLVTLEGTVESLWQKMKIEDLVADISGVLGIHNELTVLPIEPLEDEDIEYALVSAIVARTHASEDLIDVSVRHGAVTLSGSVPDWRTHRAVVDIAVSTSGVRSVHDRLSAPQHPARRTHEAP